MNTYTKKIKKLVLLFVSLFLLSGCVSSTSKAISLQYKDAKYSAVPMYEFDNGDMEIRYVDQDMVYGQILDTSTNSMYFNTVDLYCFDLSTKELKWKDYQKQERIMDYMSDDKNMYYYEYSGVQENTVASFYRFIDGVNDEKLYEEISSDLFNCPIFYKYKSSFVLLSNDEEGGVTIRTSNENGELETMYSYADLNRCIIATAKIEGDFLYFEVVNEEDKSIYRVDLTDGECSLVLKSTFDRFTVTSSYLVLHEKNNEMVYNQEGTLLRTYVYEEQFRTARWTSTMKEDEIIVTDFNNNMYYRNLRDGVCWRLSSEKDPIIKDIPVRFFTTSDSVIAQSNHTLYQIKIQKMY